MSKIVDVRPKDDHAIEILLDNNHKIIYSMKNRLNSIRFCDLRVLDIFKDVHVENGDTVIWNSFCELSLSEILFSLTK